MNPSLGRDVHAGPDGSVYLIPGAGWVCVVTVGSTGVGVVCDRVASAAAHGIGTSATGAGVTTVAGAYPDRISSVALTDESGRSRPVPLSRDNGYWTSMPGTAIELSTTAADGSVDVHTFGVPRD